MDTSQPPEKGVLPSLDTEKQGSNAPLQSAAVSGDAPGSVNREEEITLSQQAHGVAQTASQVVSDQAAELTREIGSELNKTAEGQKARGADAMETFAKAITSAAGELDAQSPTVANAVRTTAQRVEEFSASLRNRRVEELVRSASDVARSQPALFFAGAIVAGFAFSRFLKSSANRPLSEPVAPGAAGTVPAGVE